MPNPKKKASITAITPQIVQDEVVMPQILALAMTGASAASIAEQIGATLNVVNRIMSTFDFREKLRESVGKELEAITLETRHKMQKLLKKAVQVVEQNLDEGSLQAAVVVLKVGGFMEEKQNKQQDTSIQIILPKSSTNEV